jgi:ketosteroid isomerase-like protein
MTKEEQAVLTANEAFYKAFSNQDISGMEQLWSTQNDIAVIHPGWSPLLGRQSVLNSWKQIMEDSFSLDICCINASANVLGAVALVICTEILEGAHLVATNAFVLETGSWKIIHHQAGPLPQSNNPKEDDILH